MESDFNYHPGDDLQDATSEDVGIRLAEMLQDLIEGHIYPTNLRYLALFCGGANAEEALAKELNIPDSNITLVDKELPEGLQGSREGVFGFLSKAPKMLYDLVSALGVSYVINDEGENNRKTVTISEFLTALQPHLAPGAYIIIFPYNGIGVNVEGFTLQRFSLIEEPGMPVCYRYDGKQENFA